MSRKAYRKRGHMQRRGFMVVHPRWLLTGVLESNVTPACWLAWNERRNQ